MHSHFVCEQGPMGGISIVFVADDEDTCVKSKKSEVIWLRDTHPDLFQRALDMEDNARDGRHGLDTVKGLGRNFAWRELAHVKAEEVEDGPEQLRP